MFTLSNIYHPNTAQPFIKNETYVEIQPCEALKPYICCFWGTPKSCSGISPSAMEQRLVIPDTCMDIIFNIDMNKHELEDKFSGISITSFHAQQQSVSNTISTFGIRFYFWAVPLFSDESMKKALDAFAEVESYFKNFKHDFKNILIDNPSILDRIAKAEQYLLKKLNLNRQNNNVMNAVYKLLKSKGIASISELAGFTTISQRQLERLFLEYIGISPKRLLGLVRYQYLWQDVLNDRFFNVQDAVYRYGYTDQSHLLNDFKKYHTMTPADARTLAYSIM